MNKNMRPMPYDFHEMSKRLVTRENLMNHYQCGWNAVRRWLAELGEPIRPSKNGKPIPANWEKIAPTMHKAALQDYYNVHPSVINRWIALTGVEVGAPPKPKVPQRNHFSLAPTGGRGLQYIPTRTYGIHDMAADEIRRQRFAVHRCDERGRYQEDGPMWRVGIMVLTPDELLERAERYRAKVAA